MTDSVERPAGVRVIAEHVARVDGGSVVIKHISGQEGENLSLAILLEGQEQDPAIVTMNIATARLLVSNVGGWLR